MPWLPTCSTEPCSFCWRLISSGGGGGSDCGSSGGISGVEKRNEGIGVGGGVGDGEWVGDESSGWPRTCDVLQVIWAELPNLIKQVPLMEEGLEVVDQPLVTTI